MISDKTIEEKTAKYWCAFADKDFKKAIDLVLKNISDKKNQDAAQNAIVVANKKKKLDEGFMDKMNKAAEQLSHSPTVGGPGMVFQIANADKSMMDQQAKHAVASAAAGLALLPGVRDVAAAGLKTVAKHPVAAATTAAGAGAALELSNAVDKLQGKDTDGMSLLDKIGSLVNKVWDIGKFTAKHAKAIAIASTTAYALFKTANIWMPLVGSFVKSLLRGNSLATVEFDSNGTWYKMRYDIKSKRWELMYKGFSMGSTPPPEETEQLMNTKFFKRFLNQCQKYIKPIMDDDKRSTVIEAIGKMSDKKTKEAIDKVFNDDDTLKNMFALKFKY